MRVYIAGPMTGHPEFNLPAFTDAAQKLAVKGHDPVNPGRHGVEPTYTWGDYMRRGLTELLTCDGVALLPGWNKSRGAQIEWKLAADLGMPLASIAAWLR